MWYFFASFALARTVSGQVALSTYAQGQAFDKCIALADWESKTLDDAITLQDRDSGGCCPTQTTPGVKLYKLYFGAQVVCGIDPSTGAISNYGKSTSNGVMTCNYKGCYVMKQNLPCAAGNRQFLNGCCAPYTSVSKASYGDGVNCLMYKKYINNVHSQRQNYCLTYHKSYSAKGAWGTTNTADDVSSASGASMMLINNFRAYAPCDGHQMSGTTTGATTTGVTTTGTTTTGTTTTGTTTTGATTTGTTEKISSYPQGAQFTKCIHQDHFQGRRMVDDITVYNRNTNGCCPAGTVPGAPRVANIFGAQVQCGTLTNGNIMSTYNSCNYGLCHVVKQNIQCAGNAGKQFLNGCCGTAAAKTFTSTCSASWNNLWGSTSRKYCTTMKTGTAVTDLRGTADGADDLNNNDLVVSNVRTRIPCDESEVLSGDMTSAAHRVRIFGLISLIIMIFWK